MDKIFIDVDNLSCLLFDRQQIVALLDNTEIWSQIPLEQRFVLVDSFEFRSLMGDAFTNETLEVLKAEAESMVATLH